MPLYEFDCCSCGARFEELTPAGTTACCPACGGEQVRRAFSPISPPWMPAGLHGKAVRDRFVAERKRKRGEGPPGGG